MSTSSDAMVSLDIGTAWMELGSPVPTALTEARLQLHWASQVVGAVGHTFATPRGDDSHTALVWQDAAGLMVGESVGGGRPVRAALAPARFLLRLLGPDGDVLTEFSLAGATLEEAYVWMARAVEEGTGGARGGPLTRRDYDMPAHPVADGARFDDHDRRAMAELARWYHNADRVLGRLGSRGRTTAPVRIWPHHFDIGTLILLDGVEETARSIGLGLSPGDEVFGEPYWYVTPWPQPKASALPPLEVGEWYQEAWTGAVLKGTACAVAGRAHAQSALVATFLASAIPSAGSLLGATV